jgi:hypothetical protein
VPFPVPPPSSSGLVAPSISRRPGFPPAVRPRLIGAVDGLPGELGEPDSAAAAAAAVEVLVVCVGCWSAVDGAKEEEEEDYE